MKIENEIMKSENERFLTRTHFGTEAKGNLKMAYYYFETLTDCYLSTAINDNYNENTSVIAFYPHSVIPAVLASERTPPPPPRGRPSTGTLHTQARWLSVKKREYSKTKGWGVGKEGSLRTAKL